MSEVSPRLVQCFQAVFPRLAPDRIPHAAAGTLEEWDSVATVNLLTVIGEEFGVEIPWENVEQLTSYQALQRMLAEAGVPL